MTICVPGLVSILWSGIIFIAGGERSVYQDLVWIDSQIILQEDDDLFISNIRLINLKGNKLVLAGAFDVRKLLKRYSTLTPHICGNLYD